MSEIWNFTPSIESQVQQCISAASKNENNKWARHFGHLKYKILSRNEVKNYTEFCKKVDKINSPVLLSDEEGIQDAKEVQSEKSCDIDNENFEILNELLESDITSQIKYIIAECLKNHNLLKKLAIQLPTASIEKLCRHIYDHNDINKQFLVYFFKYFLVTVVKREYNGLTFDLLLKAYKIYPNEFDILLSAIIKDLDVPNKFLQDYILTLKETEKTNFLLTLSNQDLSQKEFAHNLLPFYTAYKDCTKTEQIQRYIQLIVNKYHLSFTADRNFGRLLLSFLQSKKGLKACKEDYSYLEKITESHRSPFKRPCLNVLNELKDSHNDKNMAQMLEINK